MQRHEHAGNASIYFPDLPYKEKSATVERYSQGEVPLMKYVGDTFNKNK